jgi:alpha-ribazole phosphatase
MARVTPRWLALARHPTPDIAPGICYGRLDVGLAATADAEIAAMATALGDLAAPCVWSSPARRCRIAAEAIAARLHGTVRIDPRLRELDFGAWEGLAWDRVPRDDLDRWAAAPEAFTPPGGEPVAALRRRVEDVDDAIGNAAGDAVVVSHGGPLRVLTSRRLAREVDWLAPPPPFGAVRRFSAQARPPSR